MKSPSKETVEALRREYPTGAVVELIIMNDPQAPPPGTFGRVIAIDDVGAVHVTWQMGSSLEIAYGADRCRRVDHD